MLRVLSLHKHQPGSFRPAGAPGHLDNGLGKFFAGTKVRAKQALVCVEHPDQADVRKIMALGQHLGAGKDAGMAGPDLIKQALHGAFALGRVPVYAYLGVVRQQLRVGFFHSLGALSHRCQFLVAFLAGLGDWSPGVAVVAVQSTFPVMYHHSCVTALAAGGPSAAGAEQSGCIAAPVQENQYLAALGQVFFCSQDQRGG